VIRFELEAIGSDPLPERRDLAADCIIARLTLARHTCIKRNSILRDHLSPPRAIIVTTSTFGGGGSLRLDSGLVRLTIGTNRA